MKEKAADMGKKAHKEGHLHMHEISFHYLEGDKYTDAELKKQQKKVFKRVKKNKPPQKDQPKK